MSASSRLILAAISQRKKSTPGSTQPWIDFNPFKEAGEQKQEDPGLQVHKCPENPEDQIMLATAIYNRAPEDYAFKFKKTPTNAVEMRLVIFLCEQAIKQSSDRIESKMAALDRTQIEQKKDRFDKALDEALKTVRCHIRERKPTTQERRRISHIRERELTTQERRRIREQLKGELETEELDSQIDQIKTQFRWASLSPSFTAPESSAVAQRELKELDEKILELADVYLKIARGRLDQCLVFENPGFALSSRNRPQNTREAFEVAYAIADRNILYKGLPIALEGFNSVTWSGKAKKWSSVLSFLERIPTNSIYFTNHADQMSALRDKIFRLRELTNAYSIQYNLGQPLSLEQIKRANEMQEAILKHFETISLALPKQEEEKQTVAARPVAAVPSKR